MTNNNISPTPPILPASVPEKKQQQQKQQKQ